MIWKEERIERRKKKGGGDRGRGGGKVEESNLEQLKWRREEMREGGKFEEMKGVDWRRRGKLCEN